jgi:hypothetical protein
MTRARRTDPRRSAHVTKASFGRSLRKAGCTDTKIVYRDKQHRTWKFPDLKKAREDWVKRFPGWLWTNENQDWQSDDEAASQSTQEDDTDVPF